MASSIVSRDQQVKEILKCGKDPIYFMNKYVKIQHPQRGTIPFSTFPFQDDCVRDFVKHRFNIVLKSRQIGLSTVTAAFATWLAIFHKDKNILVIATKLPTAENFIKKVKVILHSLPQWLLLPKYTDNRQSVTFSHGSQIKAIPTSEDAGRSEALSLLIVDEAAFVRNFDEIWTGLKPTLTTGGSAILLSTPNGVGGEYYSIYTDAVAGLNNFNHIKLPWNVHPEHDEEWFKEETRGFSRKKIAQEYECDFISSGDTFLQFEDIEWLKQEVKDPIEKQNDDRCVWVWRRPVSDHKYMISADVSRGDAADYSAFHVIDINDVSIAAEYKGKIPPDKLADLMYALGMQYNKAILCPENNSIGYMTCSRLKKDLKYPNLFYEKGRSPYVPFTPEEDDVPGFSMQSKSRTLVLAKLEELIRNKAIKSYSQRLIDELNTFIWNGNKATAFKGRNDDLIMSLAIGLWVLDIQVGGTRGDTKFHEAIISSMSTNSHDISEMPNTAYDVKPLVNPQIKGYNAYRPQPLEPHSNKFDGLTNLDWLLK